MTKLPNLSKVAMTVSVNHKCLYKEAGEGKYLGEKDLAILCHEIQSFSGKFKLHLLLVAQSGDN